MNIEVEQIVDALIDGQSALIELSEDNKSLRRRGNPAMPEQILNKRELKAARAYEHRVADQDKPQKFTDETVIG